MNICILGSALGTSDHLLISEDHFSWLQHIPEGVLTLGREDSNTISLDYISKLFRKPIPTFGNLPHNQFFKLAGMTSKEVHWQKTLDSSTYRNTIEKMIESSKGLASEYEKSGYGLTLAKRLEVLSTLERAQINKKKLGMLSATEKDSTQISNLQTFNPASDGMAKLACYDGSSTSTGRMKIISGPQILTLRKSHRQVIESKWGDKGEVISIDYSSLEPRVALALNGYSPDGDVYNWIDREVFDNKLGRSRAKILTLSIIYGMSLHSVKSRYGDIKPSAQERLRSMFSVEETTQKLESLELSKLKNYFGRPIFPDTKNKIFNSFIQSTAVDVAMIGFKDIITKLKEAGGCRPLFLIHDEIICDVPSSVLTSAKEILKDGIEINLKNKNVNFSVTVEKNNVRLLD